MKTLAKTVIAAAALLAGAAFASPPAATPPTPASPLSAGLCVLLGDSGQVVDARLAQTSGDPSLDQDALTLAKKLQWAPPYPKAGWLGVRITLGGSRPDPAKGSAPHCSASSDAAVASEI